jgi:hypothetical protein
MWESSRRVLSDYSRRNQAGTIEDLAGCRKSHMKGGKRPQALKRRRLFNGLAARVNSCPPRFYSLGSFFRSLLGKEVE